MTIDRRNLLPIILTLFMMGSLEALMDEIAKMLPFPKICNISYNDETWHRYTLPKPKEDQKIIINVTHLLSFADTGIFSPETSNFYYIKNLRKSGQKNDFKQPKILIFKNINFA